MYGPLLDGARESFGFIRTDAIRLGLEPANATKAVNVSFPCILYKAPNPASNKVMLISLYHPELIRILDMGDWKYVCSIETVRQESKGAIRPLCAIAKSPSG